MRTTRHRSTAAVVAAVTAALALTGCSGDPGAEPSAPMDQGMDQEMDQDRGADSGAAPEDGTDDRAQLSGLMPMSTGDPFVDTRTAAAHMPETAHTLAAGFVEALDLPGDVDSPAAELRATLTAVLQEHVYLAGMAVATAYHAGPDSGEFQAAAAALDGNSTDLADAIASLAGEEQREPFLQLWRDHIGFFVDYAVAEAGGDGEAKQQALRSLEGYTSEAGLFFEEISGGALPAAAVTEQLAMHVDTTTVAIDALAAGDPEAYAALQRAAAHVSMSAEVLAGGFTEALDLEGDPSDEASSLRAGLTELLQEHVFLAGIAVFTAYTAEGGPESEAFAAAAGVLDENSVALSEAIGSLAGDENAAAFLDLWREHIDFFVDYAVATAGDDEQGRQEALRDLDGYRPQAGAFFAELSGGELPAEAIAEGLGHHVETLAGAIDSLRAALIA